MGLGADAPNAPNYQPMLDASLQAFRSDQDAAGMFYEMAPGQISYGNALTEASGVRSQAFMQMAQEAQNWGRQQFNEIWPYAKDYLGSQMSLSRLAGENANESIIAAREGRQRANDTYDRYLRTFVPLENKFAQEVTDYADPLNATQMAGRARADVRTAGDAEQQRREAELRSYGIDPSQAKYRGTSALTGLQTAAAEAGAGTGAYERQRMGAIDLLGKASQYGQTLPASALQWLQQASQGASAGLQGGQVGGGGITGATGALTAGVTAGGSPASYSYVAGNPYGASAGQQYDLGSKLYGYGTSALGNQSNVIGAASGAQRNEFAGQMDAFNAQQKSQTDAWSGIFKGLGAAGSFLTAPTTGTLWGGLFSDRRLKEDIKPIGRFGALPMYSYRYKGEPALHVGYMADEVERVDPSAIVMHPSGYKTVDYSRATLSALGG